MQNRSLRAPLVALVLTVLAGGAQAADKSNAYIVRGLGAQPCSEYLRTIENAPQEAQAYAIWMEGYISSLNRYQPATYDAMPMTESDAVSQVVRNVCRLDPKQRFEMAIASTLAYVGPYRVTEQSQLVEVTLGDAHAAIRSSTLKWMQEWMKGKGYYKAVPDGLFNNETRAALQRYQHERKIPLTGVPDARTLGEMINQDINDKKQ